MSGVTDSFKVFFEVSSDAMLIIEDGNFVDCNPAAVKMLGFDTKHDVFKAHPAVISPPNQPDGRASFEKANEMIETALQLGSHRFDWVHKRKDGTEFPVEVSLVAIPNADKKVLNVVLRDISERQKLEQALLDGRHARLLAGYTQ